MSDWPHTPSPRRQPRSPGGVYIWTEDGHPPPRLSRVRPHKRLRSDPTVVIPSTFAMIQPSRCQASELVVTGLELPNIRVDLAVRHRHKTSWVLPLLTLGAHWCE